MCAAELKTDGLRINGTCTNEIHDVLNNLLLHFQILAILSESLDKHSNRLKLIFVQILFHVKITIVQWH